MSPKYRVWFKDYENRCWMPLSWSPIFTSWDEGKAWMASDERDWEFPVSLEAIASCEECDGLIGNSVFEQTHGYTLCHNCITNKTAKPVSMHAPGYGD